jgi:predicted transcriptional regulator
MVMGRALSDSAAREIRLRRAAGANQEDLAEQFGVSQALVSMIVNGRKYRDAGGPVQRPRPYYRRKN